MLGGGLATEARAAASRLVAEATGCHSSKAMFNSLFGSPEKPSISSASVMHTPPFAPLAEIDEQATCPDTPDSPQPSAAEVLNSSLTNLTWLMMLNPHKYYAPKSKTQEHSKPDFDYVTLVAKALLAEPSGCRTVRQICEWISRNFPYYRMSDPGWQSSVRTTLASQRHFTKVQKDNGTVSPSHSAWTFSAESAGAFNADGTLVKPARGASKRRRSTSTRSSTTTTGGATTTTTSPAGARTATVKQEPSAPATASPVMSVTQTRAETPTATPHMAPMQHSPTSSANTGMMTPSAAMQALGLGVVGGHDSQHDAAMVMHGLNVEAAARLASMPTVQLDHYSQLAHAHPAHHHPQMYHVAGVSAGANPGAQFLLAHTPEHKHFIDAAFGTSSHGDPHMIEQKCSGMDSFVGTPVHHPQASMAAMHPSKHGAHFMDAFAMGGYMGHVTHPGSASVDSGHGDYASFGSIMDDLGLHDSVNWEI